MDHLWHPIAVQISDRIDGPMKFHIVLQRILAIFLAARSGSRLITRLARVPDSDHRP